MRCIVIQNCNQCPHIDHSGAFTQGGAWPICGHHTTFYDNGREDMGPPGPDSRCLPLKPGTREYDGTIPNWCPLDKYPEGEEVWADLGPSVDRSPQNPNPHVFTRVRVISDA